MRFSAERAMYSMSPAYPRASQVPNAAAVSTGPTSVIPAKSKPIPYARALMSDSRLVSAAPVTLTHRPARIARDVVGRRDDVFVAVRGVHPPLQVDPVGKR